MFKKLLMTTALALPLAFSGAASAQTAAKKPNIVVIMARRRRHLECQRLPSRNDGRQHAQHRPHRQGRRAVHRLLRPAILHGGSCRLHSRPDAVPHRASEGRHAGRQAGPAGQGPDHRRTAQAVWYATGQIGKNHLGDRNEYLPTVHGFDEFYGILYHLNAMEEPYDPQYPKYPQFRATFGPRNIVDTKATTTDDATTDPRWGKVGKQTIADGGPLPPHPNMDPRPSQHGDVDDELVQRSSISSTVGQSQQAVLPLAQHHSHARRGPIFGTKVEGQERLRPLCRRSMAQLDATVGSIHEEARRRSASPTTLSSCSPATTAPRSSPGRMAATRRSAARRAPLTRAASGCRWWRNWPGTSSPAPSSTRSWLTKTGCRRCSPQPANQT